MMTEDATIANNLTYLLNGAHCSLSLQIEWHFRVRTAQLYFLLFFSIFFQVSIVKKRFWAHFFCCSEQRHFSRWSSRTTTAGTHNTLKSERKDAAANKSDDDGRDLPPIYSPAGISHQHWTHPFIFLHFSILNVAFYHLDSREGKANMCSTNTVGQSKPHQL